MKRQCVGGTAVGWGDSPPGPEPTAAYKAHAVSITRPTVGGLTAMGHMTPPTGRFERTDLELLRSGAHVVTK